ncbi:twin-arginine translocation signal domain-containing protein [Embleya sp. NPDC005575]|uniref:twin-arginine translocation signal domain-containing protein n=1 Tax=Embleya sp. NPDC005575 TaxID=3156892 RepID=UPI0033AC678B
MDHPTRRGVLTAAAAAAAVLATGVPSASAVPQLRPGPFGAEPYPDVVNGHADTLCPEGATWDPERRRFLVGSLRHGTVAVVHPDGGIEVLVDDPDVLVSVAGLHVDVRRDRVLLANSDLGVSVRSSPATQGVLAGVGAYHLATGERVFHVDLATVAGDGKPHFANDVAVDRHGTAYVTDSFAPIVYRVGADGSASVLVRDDRLAPPPGGFGLNGIAWQQGPAGGHLLIGKSDDGTLWRVPIADPTAVHRVQVSGAEEVFVGLDGLLARPDGTLLGVRNRLGGIGPVDAWIELRSRDGWHTADLIAVHPSPDPVPTALTPGPDDTVHQLSGRVDLLLAGTPGDTFVLRRI